MTCQTCEHDTIILYANGTRYHYCPVCGWKKEYPYS